MRPVSSLRISKFLANWGLAREALIPWPTMSCVESPGCSSEVNAQTIRCKAPPWSTRFTFRPLELETLPSQSRALFFGVAAQMMRHILVDHAQGWLAAKWRRSAMRDSRQEDGPASQIRIGFRGGRLRVEQVLDARLTTGPRNLT
jgi:hypothetical protein